MKINKFKNISLPSMGTGIKAYPTIAPVSDPPTAVPVFKTIFPA